MAFATGAFSGVTYMVESTFGVTPSTPTMIDLKQTGSSLVLNKDSFQSEQLRDDRQISDLRHGVKQVNGDINFEFSYGEYDTFLEHALFGTYSTNTLKAGTTEKSMTIERGFADITQYVPFTGCEISSMSLSIAANAIVTGTFSIVGQSTTGYSGTPLDASPTPSQTTSPFDSFTGELKEGGAAIAVITSIELNLDNAITPNFVVGSDETPQVTAGRSNLTGTVTAFFEDATLINKFINETESSIELTLGDGLSESYTFLIPRIKYSGGDNSTADEGPIEISMPFQALYDTGEATNLKITRIP